MSAISRFWICWGWGFIIFHERNIFFSHRYNFGNCENRISASQPTNIVNCFCPLGFAQRVSLTIGLPHSLKFSWSYVINPMRNCGILLFHWSSWVFAIQERKETKHLKIGQTHSKIRSRHCSAAFSLKVPKSSTHLNPTNLYISILGTYSEFVRENEITALGVCFPQPCPSAGRRFAVSRSRLTYYWQFVSFPQQWIRWNAL